jgi:hypothetical protein
MGIKCFMLEQTGQAEYWLHRSASYTDGQGNKVPEKCCPLSGYGHHAAALYGIVSVEQDARGLWQTDQELPPTSFPKWPTRCECGYEFTLEDMLAGSASPLYRDPAHPEETFKLRDAPVGAMWYADWMVLDRDPEQLKADIAAGGKFAGPDGHCLEVKLPGKWDWCVDGPATGGGHWTRTGEVPNVTANPSVWANAPHGWHGWLRNGELVDA